VNISTLRFTSYLGKMSKILQDYGIDIPKENLDIEIKRLKEKILRQQKEIDYSKKRIWKAFHCSHIAQVITGTFGDIKEVNSRFCELLEYTRDELIGKLLSTFTKDNSPFADTLFHEAVKDTLEKNERIGNTPTWEKIFIRKDGKEIITFVSVFPIMQDWHNIQYVVGRDVRPKCFAPSNEQCMYVERAKHESK
jgi:PAS domain S-box-containing protein